MDKGRSSKLGSRIQCDSSRGRIPARTSQSVFVFHLGKDVATIVHGDDFVAAEKDLADTLAILEARYKLKVECRGDNKECTHEIRVLNKVLRHTKECIEM